MLLCLRPPYNMSPQKLHEDKDRIYGGGRREEYGVDPLPEKTHPHACEYLSEKGCIIPWENPPQKPKTSPGGGGGCFVGGGRPGGGGVTRGRG